MSSIFRMGSSLKSVHGGEDHIGLVRGGGTEVVHAITGHCSSRGLAEVSQMKSNTSWTATGSLKLPERRDLGERKFITGSLKSHPYPKVITTDTSANP
jgi:hypothetical protein